MPRFQTQSPAGDMLSPAGFCFVQRIEYCSVLSDFAAVADIHAQIMAARFFWRARTSTSY
jgi:hypothetical protein